MVTLTRIEFLVGSTWTSSPAIWPALMSLFSASFFSMIFGGFGSSFFFSSAAKAGAIRKAHSGRNVQRNERIILDPLYTSQQEPWFIPHPPVYLPLTVRTNRKIEQRGPVRERLVQWGVAGAAGGGARNHDRSKSFRDNGLMDCLALAADT